MVVLANSWKHWDWCLAGIDIATGKWVRPVTTLNDGRVPKFCMDLDGYFPRILDILEIPLDANGPDFGFASENRIILPGKWQRRGRVRADDLTRYVQRPACLLHNDKKIVTVDEMRQKPPAKRVTLQLIRAEDFRVADARRPGTEKPQWRGIVHSGGRALELGITDPVFCERLARGYAPSKTCLLTLSLGMPYKPDDWPDEQSPVCWKLIAGVIEL
jgi:hypothetical protein